MAIGIETEYEWRVYPFETKQSLAERFPNEQDRQRYLASEGYISVNKESFLININMSGKHSIEEAEVFIAGLHHAVGIAKDLKRKSVK